jgi:chemotaxis protein histidine kinase CheA
MGNYRREAVEVYGQSTGLLLPILEEKKITVIINQIEALQLSFREKTEKLKKLSEQISNTTRGYIEGFNFEIKAIVEEAEAKIKAQKEIINPKIEKLNNNYKKQVERLEKSTDKEQQPLEKHKSLIEKNIKETETNIERYSKQIKIQSQRGNKRSEDSLKKKLKKEKQKLDEHQKQQKKLETQLKTLTEQKTNESSKLKSEFDREIQNERQPIINLETLRAKKQEIIKQESLKLENLTQPVLEDLNQLADKWKNCITNMKLLGLKADHEQLKNNTIIYVPFYIAAYSKADLKNKRYIIFSPSMVSSLGFSSKLRGFLGRAKIKDLFNNRFKTISSLGEKLQIVVSTSNVDFETQIEELLQKNNILNMKTTLKEGLHLLKEEGWLSETDYQTMLSA